MKSPTLRVVVSAGLPLAAVCLTVLVSLELPKTSSATTLVQIQPAWSLAPRDVGVTDTSPVGGAGDAPFSPFGLTSSSTIAGKPNANRASSSGCSGVSFVQPAGSPFGVAFLPISGAVGDFNLDGKPDVAVACHLFNSVTILLGNGNGGFAQPAGSPVNAGLDPISVAAGDFNLDGKPDLAVANQNDRVTVLLGNGGGGFTQPAGSPFAAGTGPRSVAIGDFNLDGKPDIAVANRSSGDVTILLGNGSGGFTQSAVPVGTGFGPFFIAVGDFDVNGKPDLAVANENASSVSILLGNGAGGFTQPAGSPIGTGSFPRSLAVGDFNLDAKPDLVVSNGGDNVTILLGNGSGGFTEPAGSPVGAGSFPLSVVVGDFNLDGKPDLAVASDGSNDVTLLLGNGGGGFTEPAGSPIAAGPVTRFAAVGDFNLDGKPDLAVSNDTTNIRIQLNTCDAFPCSGIGFTQPSGSPVPAGNQPQSVAVADLNLDGRVDLAVPNQSSGNVTILLGNGTGGFSEPAGSPVGAGLGPQWTAVGDFNLDGKPDLAVANGVAPTGTVTILLGNGMGSFSQAAGSPVGVGSGPECVAVGDFNRDGKPDLAAANLNSNNVTILLGNGMGGFSQPAGSPVGAGTGPRTVAVGDFNLDGKPDLAVANVFSSNVTILLGDGAGGFAQPAGSPVGAGTFSFSVAVNDLNLDGKPDLAVANFGSNDVTILLGNGMGGFSQPAGSPVGAGGGPASVAVEDFNLDGKSDLAVANINGGVTILLGNGMGGLTQPAGSPAGAGNEPISVAIGDFNLDGKPDFAVANQVSNNVTIQLNTCAGATPCNGIVCPPNVTAVTANAGDACSVITFAPPATDKCPGATVVCNPPSGSCFPVGSTTVTCTASNGPGNTATCTFTVTLFSGRLQDDFEGCNNSVLFNTITGDYRWCCHGTTFTGRGKVTRSGNNYTLEHNPADRRVLIKLSAGNSPPSGTASLQSPPGTGRCVITDRDIRNDSCLCGAVVSQSKS